MNILNISTILQRIDQGDVQTYFFSKESIRVLNIITGQESQDPVVLRNHISSNIPHDEMLRTKNIRNLLLDSLHLHEAKALLTNLNIKCSADTKTYEALHKASFNKNSDAERILFKFFEEEHTDVGSDEYDFLQIKSSETIQPKRKLFDHQKDALDKTMFNLAQGKKRCLLHMPTGSGKTVTAMRVTVSFFLRSKPSFVIWFAHSEDLCEQAVEEFQNIWKNAGDRDVDVFRFFGKHSPKIVDTAVSDKDGFVVASLSKIHQTDKRNDVFLSTLADKTNLIIIDEAHQAAAPTYESIMLQMVEKRPGSISILGLSATPGRSLYDLESSEKLANLFDHKKVTLSVTGYENPIQYLIDSEYLANPNINIIKSDSKLLPSDLEKITGHGIEIPTEILEKLGRDSNRTLKVILEIKRLIEAGHKRIIVFGATVANSRDISMILTALQYTAFHVDGKTHESTRKRYISQYRSVTDDVIIMCNYGVFTAGFDAPQTSAVVIARPTKSFILYSQMAGRAMRGKKVGGNRKCEIVTITDIKLPGFTRLVEGFFTWEDIW